MNQPEPRMLSLDLHNPQMDVLQQAGRIVAGGGVIAFPTDTTYGLGANPYNDGAVERVFQLKRRRPDKPLLILIDGLPWLDKLVDRVSLPAERLMASFWPGPLTLIFSASRDLSKYTIAASGKIGIRWPDSRVAWGLVQAAGVPVTATSANLSGTPSALTVDDVRGYFGEGLDLIIDGGRARQTVESTIVDVTGEAPVLLRAGAVVLDKIIREY